MHERTLAAAAEALERNLTRTRMRRTGRPGSPDGKQIVYSFLNDLRVMNADGSHSRVLTEGGEPSWSADGRWIAFDCGTSGAGRMCAIRPDGSGQTRILRGPGRRLPRLESL